MNKGLIEGIDMKIKPHVRRKRFYNHANDRIITRLKHFVKNVYHIIKHRFHVGWHKIPFFDHGFTHHEWHATHPVVPASKEPMITWIGHATFLIQVEGINILTDPVFYEISRVVPRVIKAPMTPDALPSIDVVIISHNHKDHTDIKSLKALLPHNPVMLVPMGNKRWFERLGFTQVVEMVWWDDYRVIIDETQRALTISFLPSSHWTSRGLFDINKTLWGSWMIQSDEGSIYFAGDTAYSKHFSLIAKHFPSIDIALMPIGPNEPRHLMADAHVSTDEAVTAFLDLQATHFIPMHWGTFKFGTDRFADPINLLRKLWEVRVASLKNKELHVVKFGERRAITIKKKNI